MDIMHTCFILNFGYEAPLPWPQVYIHFALSQCHTYIGYPTSTRQSILGTVCPKSSNVGVHWARHLAVGSSSTNFVGCLHSVRHHSLSTGSGLCLVLSFPSLTTS